LSAHNRSSDLILCMITANKNAELKRLTGVPEYSKKKKNANITLFEGHGKVIDLHTVDINGELYTAKHILISVGG
jgi:glutathione reductase (NADPH)